MSKTITRTVTTYYTAADEDDQCRTHGCANHRCGCHEPDITITVSPENRLDVVIETDLSDVPESERAGVVERATELYWAEERSAYLRSPEAERDGA